MNRIGSLLTSGLLLGLTARAGRAAGETPWLKLKPVAPRESSLPSEVLTLPPDRARVLKQAGHPYVELLRRTEIAREGTGVIRQTSTWVRHFLLDEGVRTAGNLSFTVSPLRESVEILEAWVALPGGERVALDLSTVQTSAAEQLGLFSDIRTVTLPFSGVMPGATAVMVVRSREQLARFPLRWSRHLLSQAFAPVERFELRVSASNPRASLIVHSDDPDLACRHVGRQVGQQYWCERQGVPAALFDPDVTTWLDRLPQVVVAEPQTWDELAATERKLVDRNADADEPRIKALAARLVGGATRPGERIDRLHRFVADQIRYVGLEHGEGAVVPRRASVTLRRGFGDCKDKVTLFIALARSVGITAVPALVSTGLRDQGKFLLASAGYFDHMIACTQLDGARVCLDPTVPGLPTGEIPLGLRDRLAFAIGDGQTGLIRLGGTDVAWAIEVEQEIRIACDGVVEEDTTRRFSGAGGAAMRAQLRARTTAERQRWLEEDYARVVGPDRSPTFKLDLEEPAPTLTIRSSARVRGRKDLATSTELRDADRWLTEYARSFRSGNRHHPFHHQGLRLKTRVSFQACAQMAPQFLGPALNFSSALGKLDRHYHREGSRVTSVTELSLPAAEIEQARLSGYNKFLDRALAESEIWFSLVPARAAKGPR